MGLSYIETLDLHGNLQRTGGWVGTRSLAAIGLRSVRAAPCGASIGLPGDGGVVGGPCHLRLSNRSPAPDTWVL